MNRNVSRPAVLLAVIMLAGCGGGGSHGTLPPATQATSQPAQPQKTTSAAFTIVVPPKATQVQSRNPKYVSASTQSAVITLTTVGGHAYSSTSSAPAAVATNLTTSNPACTMSGPNLLCTVAATAVVGNDAYTVSTYDAPQTSTSPSTPAGNLLSQGMATLTVTAGQAATGTLTLNGAVASLAISSTDDHVTGTAATTLSLVGMKSVAFTVSPLDAGGNTIIGPGAPTLAISGGNANVTVTDNGNGSFNAQVKSFGSEVTLTVTPSTGTVQHPTITPVQEVWVSDFSSNNIVAFSAATGTQITDDSFDVSGTQLISADANGNLWVAGENPDAVYEFAGGSLTPALTISSSNFASINDAVAVGTDVYVASGNNQETLKYAGAAALTGSQSLTASLTTTGPDQPTGLAADATGNIWASFFALNEVTSLSPGFVAGPGLAGASLNDPEGIAFDPSGNLWVGSDGGNQISGYHRADITGPATNASPFAAINLTAPAGITFDAAGNLWVTGGTNTQPQVTEFAASSLASGGTQIKAFVPPTIQYPGGIAITP